MIKIKLRVLPRSSKNEVVGEMADGTLKVKLTVAPVDGKANDALIKILADYLNKSKNKIKVVAGETSKNKIIKIED